MIDADRIASRLWIGSLPPDQLAQHGFDVVVLCAREHQDLQMDVITLRVPLDDQEGVKIDPMDMGMALLAAQEVNKYRATGFRVLVTCAAGVNRSSFVAGLALIFSGWTAPGAIQRIRDNRRPPIGLTPLCNKQFANLLHFHAQGRTRRYPRPRGQA